MLTRNYDSLTVGLLTVLPIDYSPKEADWSGGMPGVFKDHYGEIKSIGAFPRYDHTIFGNSSYTDNYTQLNGVSGTLSVLLVGSNNAEESYNDYALSVISSLTVAGTRYANISYSADDCIYNTAKTFVNNTENDITVNEVGLYQHYGTNFDILLYRKKLAQPVTLKARGGTATFNLVIDIPYANKP